MLAIRFEAKMHKVGPGMILRLPEDASAKLPSRGQVAVKGVMNRHDFQTVLEPSCSMHRPRPIEKRQANGTGVKNVSSASSRAAEKFKTRYATFGFNDAANLDEGTMWPTSFALKVDRRRRGEDPPTRQPRDPG
jgi:hypothetical protein